MHTLPSSGIPSSPDDSSCSQDEEIVIIEYDKNSIIESDNQNESIKEDQSKIENQQSLQNVENENLPCNEMFNNEDSLCDQLEVVIFN